MGDLSPFPSKQIAQFFHGLTIALPSIHIELALDAVTQDFKMLKTLQQKTSFDTADGLEIRQKNS